MIAQQDYLHFKQSMPIAADIDCELLAFLIGGIERKTIWDMIITTYPDLDLDDENSTISRVLNVSTFDSEIIAGNNFEINFSYSSLNYSGLAAIQRALLAAGEEVASVPALYNVMNVAIGINGDRTFLTTPDGYAYVPTIAEGKLVSIKVGTTLATENALAISEEDAQKLIGLPVA